MQFSNKIYTKAILSNSTRKLSRFEITKMPIAVIKDKFIVLFIIIVGTFSFRVVMSKRLAFSTVHTRGTLCRLMLDLVISMPTYSDSLNLKTPPPLSSLDFKAL